jgi:hypothetical protein
MPAKLYTARPKLAIHKDIHGIGGTSLYRRLSAATRKETANQGRQKLPHDSPHISRILEKTGFFRLSALAQGLR